jgi:DNA-binding NarL/FixJ family response regulator
MAQTRLLIVPSDFVAWPGLIDQLRAVETVRVVGVTRSWSEALRVGEISRPNVVLAAEPCGDEPVLQPLRQMRRILPNARFVILTTSFDPDHLLMLAEVGVSGYLRWDGLTSYDTLPHLAIAMNGKTVVLHNDIAEAYVNAMRTRFCLIAEPPTISEREGRILSMMGRGYSVPEIAAQMEMSPRTVERAVAGLRERFGAGSREELLIRATLCGYLP